MLFVTKGSHSEISPLIKLGADLQLLPKGASDHSLLPKRA